MGVTVSNCSRCNKIFQKIFQPLCPACCKIEDEKFSVLYRTLQKSGTDGGMPIDALSLATDVPVEDIDRYFQEGKLGTAETYLLIHCQVCNALCSANQRLGRFCVTCSEATATKAGVEVQDLRELTKRHAEEERLARHTAFLQENHAKRTNYGKFGSSVK